MDQTKAHNPTLHQQLAARMNSGLPAHLGIELVEVRHGFLCARMKIAPHHIAANAYLHAGSVVTLADTSCGFGCIASLPEGASNFTTVELKTNFLRTTLSGTVYSEATLVHSGRRTQVWDALVYVLDEKLSHQQEPDQNAAYSHASHTNPGQAMERSSDPENRRTLALFRCTQMILYPTA